MLKSLITLAVVLTVASSVSSFGIPSEWSQWIDHSMWKQNNNGDNTLVNKTECVFFRRESIFSCQAPKMKTLECSASWQFKGLDDESFNSFGIGLDQFTKFENKSINWYDMYPRMTNYPRYLTNWIALEEKHGEFVMAPASQWKSELFYGIQFARDECWAEMRSWFFRLNKWDKVEIASYKSEKPWAKIISNVWIL